PLTDFGGKTSIFSHPVYLFLREFSLQDFRGGSLAGKVQVKWGEEENAHCVANYQLPPESQQQLLTQLSAECR
ncbi:hypothetical protein NEO06_05595, partial [Escherichia coli]|nr:hypothetical protein [Escherichia coli]MDI0481871.1 hypothetical protein [Escherichia coli]